jgi:hypothetical protein
VFLRRIDPAGVPWGGSPASRARWVSQPRRPGAYPPLRRRQRPRPPPASATPARSAWAVPAPSPAPVTTSGGAVEGEIRLELGRFVADPPPRHGQQLGRVLDRHRHRPPVVGPIRSANGTRSGSRSPGRWQTEAKGATCAWRPPATRRAPASTAAQTGTRPERGVALSGALWGQPACGDADQPHHGGLC